VMSCASKHASTVCGITLLFVASALVSRAVAAWMDD
jgi:hypothetical protein